jgi:hypothetical protein
MTLWHCQSKMSHGCYGMVQRPADGLGRPIGPRGEDNSKAAVRVPGKPEFYIKTEIVEDNDGQ